MEVRNVFVGNVRWCTHFEKDGNGNNVPRDMLLKEDAILVSFKERFYVDVEKINGIFDYFGATSENPKLNMIGHLLMTYYPICDGDLFVDESTLKPFEPNKEQGEDISFVKLKQLAIDMHSQF